MSSRNFLQSTTMLTGLIGCTFLATATAWADGPIVTNAPPPTVTPAPAVDAVNEKFDAFGGSIGNESIYGVDGSVTVPLQGPFGAQLDSTFGSLGGNGIAEISGHWFWRDPASGLFGLYGSEAYWDRYGGINVGHVGAEGEHYWGPFTVQGIAGVEFGNSASTASSITTVGPIFTTISTFVNGYDVRTRFFDEVNLKYYLTEDVSAYVGQRYLGGENALALGAEVAKPLGHGIMASAFVEGRVGQDNFHGIWGGLKFYFGPTDKSLMARHRQEDPNNWNVDNLFGITNNQTSSSSSAQSCTLGPGPGPGGCETPFFGDA